ncbi:MAG: sensor domain-containing diguanylate cyclase [Myxococcales bacterium]|nr:sensor domain-containing diguanylate cyclase [Myxococcales bacterium]
MAGPLRTLTALALQIGARLSLEELLGLVADHAALMLGVERASVRLLDPTSTRLIAVARAGMPLHDKIEGASFALGEGLLGWIASHAEPIRTGDAEHDPRFAERSGKLDHLGSFVGVPLVAGARCIGVLSAVSAERDAFSVEHEDILLLLAAIAAPHIEIARLSRLSQVDALTGVMNRHGLEAALPEANSPERVAAMPCTVALIDIDGFKRVNDEHGHAVGDEVLKRVAEELKGMVRASDAVVRLGGDEFLMVLTRVGLARGAAIAERARAAIAAGPLHLGGHDVHVTISAGIARLAADDTREQVLERADQALYSAKHAGKNRVAMAGYAAPKHAS